MTRLRLFTVFHGNLDFSALPERDLPLVISRCYWPLLALAQEASCPLGIELSARTLLRIAGEDPEWLKSFCELRARGLVELVGSGLAQVVAPLAPVDVNRANLREGRRAYQELLGDAPRTWFVHEQTYARGLATLHREIGAEALVMEWNNPASGRSDLRRLRHRPARVAAVPYEPLPLLWNDCVVFQKLQRVAHGEIPPEEYLSLVARTAASPDERLFCVYGGDLEIFDYRPGGATPAGAERGEEWRRIADVLRALARHPACEMRLPADVLEGLEPGPVVDLVRAEQPIPCKKQPRYNPTRWAVSGRDGLGMNTRCHELRRLVRCADALEGVTASAEDPTLVTLWGSDFRTRATEERIETFQVRVGAALDAARRRLARLVPSLGESVDVAVTNPWPEPWTRQPVEIPISFAPGRLAHAALVAEPASAIDAGAWQLEVDGRYRDGSVRSGTLVLEPELGPGETLRLRVLPGPAAVPEQAGHAWTGDALATESVEASFLLHRGGALAAARFPAVDRLALVGTIPHGTFDEIAYTPDFYSGLTLAVGEDGLQTADLSPAGVAASACGPVRTSIEFRVTTRLGEWSKTWRLYRRHPRLDLVQTVRFQETRLRSLRLGVCTWLPDAFDRRHLGFATTNGGAMIERFALGPGTRVEQSRAVSASVSASSCLGATEGWISAGDERRGVALVVDRSAAAVVPLLDFTDVDESFLLRVHQSAAERDETSAHFVRGARRFAFAWLAHRDDLAAVRACARAVERGLPYRTSTSVGVARGV